MIRIPLRGLRIAGLFCLLLPCAAFLLTWLRPVFGLSCALMLMAALYLFIRRDRTRPSDDLFGQNDVLCLSALSFAAVIACALLWTLLSGIGGAFYQTEDHWGRNAIFHDLLEHPWPVYFDGTPYALTYYIAYWVLPALTAKLFAFFLGDQVLWAVGNAALFVQTVVFLFIIFLLLLALVRARSLMGVLASLLIFVLFSGLDALPAAFLSEPNDQIEWWAGVYQFSSHTTCLFWVYNQAVPAWLASLLLLSRPRDTGWYAFIGLCAFPFSPMPFVGLFVFMLLMAVCVFFTSLRQRGFVNGPMSFFRECFSAPNLLAIAAILPAFGSYFLSNQAAGDGGFTMQLFFYAFGPFNALCRLTLFELVEFGLFAMLLLHRYRKDPLFFISLFTLILSPMFRLGYKADFSMRASIPGLTILCVYTIRYLLCAFSGKQHRAQAAVLALLLLIGSITPLKEFESSAYKVKVAGTPFLTSDPFKTVLHPSADTFNFICRDVKSSFFYNHLARKGSVDQ